MRLLLAARLAAGAIIVGALCACSGPTRHSTKDKPHEIGVAAASATGSADVRVELADGLGSGVYIGNGIIITAAHVVYGAREVKLRSDVGDVQTGEVLWVNTAYDIAAIRPASAKRFAEARLECRSPEVGEAITAVGNPVGVEFIAMRGYVSGGEREVTGFWRTVFAMDATTMQGMSGGPVYDADGDVVGITVGVVGTSPGGGLGLAVPASVVCGLIGRAVTT
jgi:serine protease Do